MQTVRATGARPCQSTRPVARFSLQGGACTASETPLCTVAAGSRTRGNRYGAAVRTLTTQWEVSDEDPVSARAWLSRLCRGRTALCSAVPLRIQRRTEGPGLHARHGAAPDESVHRV